MGENKNRLSLAFSVPGCWKFCILLMSSGIGLAFDQEWSDMASSPLLPLPAHWRIVSFAAHDGRVDVNIAVTSKTVLCPVCHTRAERVHSRYSRTLADVPAGGQRVFLHVTVRKFFCPNCQCDRTLFTEQSPPFAQPHARMTNRLIGALQALGMVAGGEAGSRLASRLGLPTSPATLLRFIMRVPVPLSQVVRVLGVDEWAWKKGWRYGTILVDLLGHQVVDILPDDTVATVCTWLIEHPGVELIARDRANAFADVRMEGENCHIQKKYLPFFASFCQKRRSHGSSFRSNACRHFQC